MSKFSKILIFVSLILFASLGFNISFSYAQETKGTVYVCPNATSLEEINPRCPGKIILKLGETINGMTLTTTNHEGQDYYLILGFINGGAGNNFPPIADANGPYQGYGGLPITFDGGNSSDPNDDPLQYRWDFNNDGIWDTEWLNISTIDHIWNNDYEGTVKLEVNDGEFTDTATTSVSIISPRTFKEKAINELETAKTGNKRIDRRIDRIIKRIENSLDNNLWIDASHLVFFTGSRTGTVVFHFERTAVRLMMRELKSKRTPEELKQVFEKVIGKLVKADTLLAEVSLFDAKNTPIQNPKFQKIVEFQIKKAKEELAKAKKELSKNRPDKAISRIAKSWLHCQLAIKFANLKK